MIVMIALCGAVLRFHHVTMAEWRTSWKRRLFMGLLFAVIFVIFIGPLFFHLCTAGQPVPELALTTACVFALIVCAKASRTSLVVGVLVLIMGAVIMQRYTKLVHIDKYCGNPFSHIITNGDAILHPAWHSWFTKLYRKEVFVERDEFSRVNDITLDLRVDSSFGHFAGYTPPQTNQHLLVALGAIPSLQSLEFTDGENPQAGLISSAEKGFPLTNIQRGIVPDVITMRFVSEDEKGKYKATFDIELFGPKGNFDKGTARAWLVLEVDGHLTQGIAGLTGTFERKKTSNQMSEVTGNNRAGFSP
ncbi:MAG: hypothetical protein HY343_08030 [Lentisphaerae bacterium]|nr:hypothetical protein [Lentisphaerota bacterium]